MKRNLKRLFLALVISTGCFALSVIWFESGKVSSARGSRTPIARLDESNNDVQRKPTQRVIWEAVSKNEDLYAFDAIRTFENADAKIQLLKSGTIVTLEPNSLVVLEENETGLSLDFLQGNLFVSATGQGDVTLKTGAGEVKLNSADLSLSRDQNGKVDLAVLQGQAELQQGDKKMSLNKDKSVSFSQKGMNVIDESLRILWPVSNESVLLNLGRDEKLNVQFKPLAKGYQVFAEWGRQRHELQTSSASVPGESGKIPLKGKAGKWFMRLSAKADDPSLPRLSSSTIAVIIEPKSPPALMEPKEDLIKESADAPISFRWLNRHNLESQIFEVASDAQFKALKAKEIFGGQVSSHSLSLPGGTYFWRVTGFLKLKEKREALVSAARFTVHDSWELKAPVLVAPTAQQRVSHLEAQDIALTWKPAVGVKRYALWVQGPNQFLLEKETDANVFHITDVKPGKYLWQVSSLDPKGKNPKTSTTWTFEVEDTRALDWASAETLYEYSTPTPSLRAEWKALPGATYRFRLANTEWKNTSQNYFETPVPADGDYGVIVEALNAKGQTMAQTSQKVFTVKRRPLLPAPQWAQSTPETLQSDYEGNLSFSWQEVEGAKHYQMILADDEGQVVEKKSISRNTASLKGLKPGQYQVRLRSVDDRRRAGEASPAKTLVVPVAGDLKAPKIKNMKVK